MGVAVHVGKYRAAQHADPKPQINICVQLFPPKRLPGEGDSSHVVRLGIFVCRARCDL